MNVVNEKQRRIKSLICNIKYLCDLRKIKTKKDIAKECEMHEGQLGVIAKRLKTKESTLDRIEPYIECLAVREGKTNFFACNGQRIGEGVRDDNPDKYRKDDIEIMLNERR